ncbi:MAG: murein biosynthesis integral membrane protein MurJ [Verrucomicrobiaceae bacterium]|nr:MAG: murein biosynthesis integral membrane protein MurJ [Verrucomicrobiaceae bacterium]
MSDGKKLNTRASGVIAAAVMFSRLLGLVREVLFNSLFGTASMGLFIIAFRIPNLLRDLFAEGALSTAFVTVFSQRIEKEGEKSAWVLASKMMTLVAVFMSLVSLLGIVFSRQLVSLLAAGFAPDEMAFTILLTQIMYPFILLVSLAALVMGMLNSRNIFTAPAMASSFFNIGSIAGGAYFGWLIDHGFGQKALVGLALGTLLGGFLQLVTQFPSLRRAGFAFLPDFRWRDPGIRRILVLMVPSVIAASAVQVNVLINTGFAAHVGADAVTWLNSAFRLMQLPIGVFGVAVATITLPVVSRIAVDSDTSRFGPTLGTAMRLAVFLTLPAAVGLWFLAGPIIGLIYEHGKFHANDTLQTGIALQFYAMGLVAYSCIKVLSPAFYAINRKWTPMLVSFGSVALNIALNSWFLFHLGLGHRGLALSTTICAILNFTALYLLMLGPAGRLDSVKFLLSLGRCAAAAVPLGLVCWAGMLYLPHLFPEQHFWQRAVGLFATILAASLSYLGTCFLLGVEETGEAARIVLRKFRRKSP